jgi:hypothetical protein
MGSESIGSVTITDAAGHTVAHAHEVKVLLESQEVIFRGALRRRLPISRLTAVTAAADRLRFTHSGETYELTLGEPTAARWAKKILAPPPTLAAKLGVSPERPAIVIGAVTDPVLAEAVQGATAERAAGDEREPVVAIAEVDDLAQLDAVLTILPAGLPIWVVHRKGADVAFGENAIRAEMRGRGYVDTKVSAVSHSRTATRYSPPR